MLRPLARAGEMLLQAAAGWMDGACPKGVQIDKGIEADCALTLVGLRCCKLGGDIHGVGRFSCSISAGCRHYHCDYGWIHPIGVLEANTVLVLKNRTGTMNRTDKKSIFLSACYELGLKESKCLAHGYPGRLVHLLGAHPMARPSQRAGPCVARLRAPVPSGHMG